MHRHARYWTLCALLTVVAGGLWISLWTLAPSKPRVLILMFSTPSIVPKFAGAAVEINAAYARRHGYGFKHIVKEETDHAAMVWKMVDVLRQHHGQADALFWIDSDAVFNPTKHHQSLEWLFALPGDIIGCSDHPNGKSFINTGTLFVKDTPVAKEMLATWWSARDAPEYTSFPYEQKALGDLAKVYPSVIRARPADEFNSVYSDLRAGKRDSFVLHFMSYSAEKRASEFARLKEQVMS